MDQSIIKHQEYLKTHPMYSLLNSVEAIQIFMKFHVFAVWDFMSLLKALQKEITCVNIPWNDSPHDPELVHLINEIVLAEESDIDLNGEAKSHFKMYLEAMNEIGADTKPIENFLKNFDLNLLPDDLKTITSYHLDLALNGDLVEVASSFFYGREKLIPEMFESIVKVLDESKLECPKLLYYLKRHIELDGDEHGPMAEKCLNRLINTEGDRSKAIITAQKSLEMRKKLWTFIERELTKNHSIQITEKAST